MFTKYNNVNIPKNYSGNRFRQNGEDTEMKTHRPISSSTVPTTSTKTSVSPYFQAQLTENELPSEELFNSLDEEIPEVRQEENSETIDTPTDKIPKSPVESDSTSVEENKLTQFLKNIKNDDLLLLALILLLANDNTENSADALAILALLLMYH